MREGELPLLLPREWEVLDGIRIHDPDGWRGKFTVDGTTVGRRKQ